MGGGAIAPPLVHVHGYPVRLLVQRGRSAPVVFAALRHASYDQELRGYLRRAVLVGVAPGGGKARLPYQDGGRGRRKREVTIEGRYEITNSERHAVARPRRGHDARVGSAYLAILTSCRSGRREASTTAPVCATTLLIPRCKTGFSGTAWCCGVNSIGILRRFGLPDRPNFAHSAATRTGWCAPCVTRERTSRAGRVMLTRPAHNSV